MNCLLLFDIDGTLVDTQGAGLASLEEGLFDAFPEKKGLAFPPLDLGGATDGGVVMQLFEHFEIVDTPENRVHFFHRYSLALDRRLHRFRDRGRGRALPGCEELLKILKAEARHLLGLLTGNTEAGARIKLRHFGLEDFFAVGAFGDDHHDRNRLGPIAMERAHAVAGRTFAAEETVIIGDTLKDIACARACGAAVVAVATGMASAEQLRAAEPDAFLPDLADSDRAIAAIDSAINRRQFC